MCGIAGVVGVGDEARVRQMCARMRHRGPDDEGYHADGPAVLGMVRLAIIDLVSGRQPMTDEHRRYWVVFNGEIYNHRTLRQELEQRGHRFVTQADTEVIVHLYEEQQERCVEQLNGDFAFAVWDTQRQRLVLARDRLGVKPLYYWHAGNRFAFASELKALLRLPEISRTLDPAALDAYLTFLYVPAPLSIFQSVRKVPPGCWLSVERGEVRIERYWTPAAGTAAPPAGPELRQAVRAHLEDAVRLRLMSDVPLGAFLSGGIDSSCVVALMSRHAEGRVKTFSIGFEKPYDSYNELPAARMAATAFHTDHQEFIVKPDIAALLPQVVRQMDEPFADSSALLTFLISREARRTVTVALTGIGGDELFGGYPRYLGAWASLHYERVPRVLRAVVAAAAETLPESTRSRNLRGWIKRFTRGSLEAREVRYLRWLSHLQPEHKDTLFTAALHASLTGRDPYAGHQAILRGAVGDYLDRINLLDVQTYLPDDLLVMGDKMSMAHGLEVRVPFCDHRLVELAAAVPMRRRMAGYRLKGLLKEALTGMLPDALLRKPKQGFMLPMNAWMKGELQPLCRELLSETRVRRRGLFHAGAVARRLEAHQRGVGSLTHQLYALMVFELWCEQYLDAA